ncbi:MAG: hypothetical protein PUH54_01525 [Oscillospiraceae bacterium]|nr:hypothetical protein [Oscillospiraceae bacterium]
MKNKIFLCTALLSVLALCGCNQKAEESFYQSDISSTAETTTVSVSTSAATSTTTTNTTTATTTTLKATATSESVTSVSDKVTETVKPDVTDDSTDGIEITENNNNGGFNPLIIDENGVVIVEQQEPVYVDEEPQNYNQDIYEKLGIKVNLTGTNEEQARQYYEACKEAYPNLPWVDDGIQVSVDVSSLRSEIYNEVWSMTDEECDALLQERLAGRDYHDLSLEELAQIVADFPGYTDLSAEIDRYFNDLTGRDFNAGGFHGVF